jgi:uncharacterized protein (DUF2141 family)
MAFSSLQLLPVINRSKWFRISLCMLIFSMEINAQIIEVKITGIRSAKGQILLDIYTDDKSFEDEKPHISKIFSKRGMADEEMTVKLNLDPGIYGLTLVDDENENGKMDYRFIGLTKEGFGFSNFFLTGLKKPAFDDFKFVAVKGQKQTVIMKIRYM